MPRVGPVMIAGLPRFAVGRGSPLCLHAKPRRECWFGHSATRRCTEGGDLSGACLLEAPRLDDNDVWMSARFWPVFAWTSNCAIRVAKIRRPARHAGRAGHSTWQLSHRYGAPSPRLGALGRDEFGQELLDGFRQVAGMLPCLEDKVLAQRHVHRPFGAASNVIHATLLACASFAHCRRVTRTHAFSLHHRATCSCVANQHLPRAFMCLISRSSTGMRER